MKSSPEKLSQFSLLFLAFLLFPSEAFACSCETYGVPRTDAREYYSKKFDGAIFTGTVASIKHDPAAAYSAGITFSELTVNVDQYWLGVSKPSIVIVVFGPNTSCSRSWKIGQEEFFIASNYEGRLHFALCDRVNWMSGDSKISLVNYTTDLLGKPKSFPKPNELDR